MATAARTRPTLDRRDNTLRANVARRRPEPRGGARPIASKFCAPSLPPHHIERSRLIRELATGDPLLRLVVGPPGVGKSVLVQSWAADHDGPFGWLTLERGDDSEPYFWRLIGEAIQRATNKPNSVDTTHADQLVDLLQDHVERLGVPVTLALEDYHLVANPAIHAQLARMLDIPTRPLRLVITTRADPPLPMSRWRARNDLVELRETDLRFHDIEALEFLNRLDCWVSARDGRALNERAEGWVTALQLAALTLRHSDDPATFVEQFDGTRAGVTDFLLDEVVDAQPPEVQTFLRSTSLLEAFTAPLCDEVLGRTGSEEVLAHLQRNQVFLVPLDNDRVWYRYQRLFADALRHDLRLHDPSAAALVHARAARWYSREHHVEAALAHAFAADDYDLVLELLATHRADLLQSCEWPILVRWLDELPEEYIEVSLSRTLAYASALAGCALPGRAAMWAARAERKLGHPLPGLQATIQLGHALHAAIRGDERGFAAHLPPDPVVHGADVDPLVARCALLWRARLAIAAERFGEARATYDALVRNAVSDRSAEMVLVTPTDALVDAAIGNLHTAASAAEVAIAQWRDRGGGASLTIADALLARAWVHLEQGELDDAESVLGTTAIRGVDPPVHFLDAWVTVLRGEIARARGAPAECLALVRDRSLLGTIATGSSMHARVAELEVKAALDVADVARAERVLARVSDDQTWARLRARIDLARGDLTAARWAVARLSPVGPRRTLEARLLQARAHLDDRGRARALVERCVSLGLPGGYAWSFAQERELLPLYREIAPASRLASLDTLFPRRASSSDADLPPIIQPLSERELAVLHLLPTHLSNREMADELYVSLNTIKTHLKSVYRKLGAISRSEAVLRARRHGLLPPAVLCITSPGSRTGG